MIIVDEPTAGLDPGERNRFHNLLAEIGENIIVILSTHIVEDVADLCSQMAIISHGRVLLTGDPMETITAMKGRIWKKTIAKSELASCQESVAVISTRLVGGRTVIHVLAESDPGNGFAEVDPDLEDVYFSTLSRAGEIAAA